MFLAYFVAMAELFAPTPSQSSIDNAIVMYNIQVPSNVTEITYNPDFGPNLYGLANLDIFGLTCKVQIGPEAFSSWSFLGSILAHEVEAHCNESSLELSLAFLGFKDKGDIERRAYWYQLSDENIQRFGNTPDEVYFFEIAWRTQYPMTDGTPE